jgi:hypothetical protein
MNLIGVRGMPSHRAFLFHGDEVLRTFLSLCFPHFLMSLKKSFLSKPFFPLPQIQSQLLTEKKENLCNLFLLGVVLHTFKKKLRPIIIE